MGFFVISTLDKGMSDEITISQSFALLKSNSRYNLNPITTKVDWSGTHKHASTQDIGTSDEALSIGADLGTAGWAIFTNLDTTNYVEVGTKPGAFVPFLKILPGETVMCRISNSALYARANTATVKLDYVIFEA